MLMRGDVQENQLPRNVPAQGTVKLQNGHFTDESDWRQPNCSVILVSTEIEL